MKHNETELNTYPVERWSWHTIEWKKQMSYKYVWHAFIFCKIIVRVVYLGKCISEKFERLYTRLLTLIFKEGLFSQNISVVFEFSKMS